MTSTFLIFFNFTSVKKKFSKPSNGTLHLFMCVFFLFLLMPQNFWLNNCNCDRNFFSRFSCSDYFRHVAKSVGLFARVDSSVVPDIVMMGFHSSSVFRLRFYFICFFFPMKNAELLGHWRPPHLSISVRRKQSAAGQTPRGLL